LARARWVDQKMSEALPISYYHVVFTIPHELNSIVLHNKRPFYNLMFKAVSETLMDLGKDQKFLGGLIGCIAILHTWGQNLMYHPHIHCIIPAGALGIEEDTWIKGRDTFLFPVAVMQKLFRGKCMDFFLKAVENGTINPLSLSTSQVPSFEALKNTLYSKKWVVHVKEPFTEPKNLFKYIARYTHRIAISNHRILKVDNDQVTFSYKDYADQGKKKTMTVTAMEFIRRFMLHILPHGFMRIRQYGFLSNVIKKKKLALVRKLIPFKKTTIDKNKSGQDIVFPDPFACPECKKGVLKKYREVAAIKHYETKVVNN
jgi:hypothetical protein